jgi:hypothetical protein
MAEVEVTYDQQPVGQSVLVPGFHLDSMIIYPLSLWRLWVSWYWASSLMRGQVCNLLVQFLLGLARAVTLGSKSCRTHGHILLSHLRLPQPGDPGPCVYIPRNSMAQLYPRALGSLFVAFYSSQGCVGCILTRLHTGRMHGLPKLMII